MSATKIEWATHVWNPVTGCTKVSEGCRNCYAERQVNRLGKLVHGLDPHPRSEYVGLPIVAPFTRVLTHSDRLDQPLHWRKPRRVFVCSMSDLFHPDVPFAFVDLVFAAMALSQHHTFMVLTKRPNIMRSYLCDEERRTWVQALMDQPAWVQLPSGRTFPRFVDQWPLPNVWLGVSIENQATADERIPLLLQTPAAVRFVSCEPMLGPVDLYGGDPDPRLGGVTAGHGVTLEPCWYPGDDPHGPPRPGLDWVICGGESGPGARPMHPDWARSLRDQCQAAGVPFFFKQWGEWAPNCLCGSKGPHRTTPRPEPGHMGCMFRCGKKAAGREIDGRTWDEAPQSCPGALLPGVGE